MNVGNMHAFFDRPSLVMLVTTNLWFISHRSMCRIKCFTVCSIVGVLVLAPTNYTSEGRADIRRSNSMELFTVTNVTRGSNRLALLCIFHFHIRGIPYNIQFE